MRAKNRSEANDKFHQCPWKTWVVSQISILSSFMLAAIFCVRFYPWSKWLLYLLNMLHNQGPHPSSGLSIRNVWTVEKRRIFIANKLVISLLRILSSDFGWHMDFWVLHLLLVFVVAPHRRALVVAGSTTYLPARMFIWTFLREKGKVASCDTWLYFCVQCYVHLQYFMLSLFSTERQKADAVAVEKWFSRLVRRPDERTLEQTANHVGPHPNWLRAVHGSKLARGEGGGGDFRHDWLGWVCGGYQTIP